MVDWGHDQDTHHRCPLPDNRSFLGLHVEIFQAARLQPLVLDFFWIARTDRAATSPQSDKSRKP